MVYGLLSLTDKLSSGIAIMVVQAWDPCVPPRRLGGAAGSGEGDGTCAAAGAYYRRVMVWVPGVAAGAALAVLLAGASVRGARVLVAEREARPASLPPTAAVPGDAEGTVREGVRGSRLADRLAAAAAGDAAVPLLPGEAADTGRSLPADNNDDVLQTPSTPPHNALPAAAELSPARSPQPGAGGSNFDSVIFHI